MNQPAIKARAPEETTCAEVYAKCRSISWPDKSEIVTSCGVSPDRPPMEIGDDGFSDVVTRFCNEYVYPQYKRTYFETFPADRAKITEPGFKLDQSLDYNRKTALALCDWLREHGHFHCFDGRIVFVACDIHDLACGGPLDTDALLYFYQQDCVASLLDCLLNRCVELRRKQDRAMNWAIGLGIAAGVLAMTLFSIIAT